MKKYFLLAVLMMVVFLWWGNYTMGQDWTQIDLWESSSTYTWPTNSEVPTNPYSDQITNYEMDPNQMWSSDSTDLWSQVVLPVTACTRSWSILYLDLNAEDVAVGLLCKCKTGYGEYYDTALNKPTCQPCSRKDVCCGVKLNTNVPFIGNCLEQDTSDPSAVSPERAFPVLMSSLTKILVTVILIVSFVLIVVGGIMIASAWANQSRASEWRKLIMKVVVGIALLGASGVILRLINPNFFG